MKQKIYFLRPAIAMIELIFAIVVMGIVMLSVPQLLTTASDSSVVAIQQEGISEAATQLNIIMGYEWDENNTIDGHTTVLNTNGNANLRSTLISPTRRTGTPATSQRLFKSYDGSEFSATAVLSLGADGGDLDDIDDVSGGTNLLEVEVTAANTANSDYLEKATVQIGRTVTYMSDTTTAGGTFSDPGADKSLSFNPTFATHLNTSNIKHIQVTLSSNSGVTELDKTITLRAFSCNIGSFELEERQ